MRSARAIVEALHGVASMVPLVVPLHPRGRANLEAAGLRDTERIRIVEPLGYVAFLSVVAGARLVLTDSGGIQEETTILDVPCLTIRPNTERPITISHGTNRLVAPTRSSPPRVRSSPARSGRAVHDHRCGTATPANGSPTSSTGWRAEREAAPLVEQRA